MHAIRTIKLLTLICAIAIPCSAFAAGHEQGLAAALASGDRSDADKQRDAGRKPAEVIAFLGIEPGMTVLDLVAASGYYTEVLSVAVGDTGKVYAQNPEVVLEMREGANDKAMTARLANGRLNNVERLDMDVSEIKVELASIDAAITALNFHDIYNGRGVDAATSFLMGVYALLEPDGVLGIIDHHGKAGVDNEKLHRIRIEAVHALIEGSPFELDGSSEALRNPEDDHTLSVFDEAVRGKTDRFLLRLRKTIAPPPRE